MCGSIPVLSFWQSRRLDKPEGKLAAQLEPPNSAVETAASVKVAAWAVLAATDLVAMVEAVAGPAALTVQAATAATESGPVRQAAPAGKPTPILLLVALRQAAMALTARNLTQRTGAEQEGRAEAEGRGPAA